MVNISLLVNVTPRFRHLIAEYALQGKVVESAALLKVACSYPIDFSAMYIPTDNLPPELHFGVPAMLRQLVATRSASLIKEGIQLSASLNPEENDNCRIKIKQMDSIRTLLEYAERGDLNGYDVVCCFFLSCLATSYSIFAIKYFDGEVPLLHKIAQY